ncbi:hypothetical protein [Streptomyces sp. HC307]|uniref:hypothetical protein n=1 Tax=Streptomyces flavusporus TaxID=3385496 RepID=UPI003917652E
MTADATAQPPYPADLFVDEKTPAGHEAPLVEALTSLGFAVRARAVPTRRPVEQLAWIMLIALPLQAFLSALGSKLAEDTHQFLRNAIAKVGRRDSGTSEPSAETVGPVVLQDPATGLQIILGPHLDEEAYRKLRALDLSQYTHGPVRYDTAEGRWLSDIDEATRR